MYHKAFIPDPQGPVLRNEKCCVIVPVVLCLLFFEIIYPMKKPERLGVFFVFSGPSGAGKTTLLQILGTLDVLDKKENAASSLEINDTSIILNKFISSY